VASGSAIHPHKFGAVSAELARVDTLLHDAQLLGALDVGNMRVAPIPVSLGVILAEAVSYARTLPGQHPIHWPQTLRARVWADPERIVQVLRNLLSNAAKYSPNGSPIEITVNRVGDRLRIAVSDHGPGVHPNDTGWIFGYPMATASRSSGSWRVSATTRERSRPSLCSPP